MKLALTFAALVAASPGLAEECLPVAVTVSDVSVTLGDQFGKLSFAMENGTEQRIDVIDGSLRFFDVLGGRLGFFSLPRFPELEPGETMAEDISFMLTDRMAEITKLPVDAWTMQVCVQAVYP